MSGTNTTAAVAGGTYQSAGGVFDQSAVNQLVNAAQLGSVGNGAGTLSVGTITVGTGAATVGGTLAVLGAQTAITSVSTITAMNSTTVTVPAGALNVVGKTLRVRGYFVFSNGATTPAITITLKLGTVTMSAPVSAANANSNSSSPSFFEFTAACATTGATGTMEAHGLLQMDTADATAGNALTTYPSHETAVSSAVDLTSALALTINMTVSSGPVTTATLRQAVIELLN
jgi:hypothetical protein